MEVASKREEPGHDGIVSPIACVESPSNESESPFALTWTDHFLGRRVSLRLDADGIPLPPAGQRAHIMRVLEHMQAAAWFFARRSAGTIASNHCHSVSCSQNAIQWIAHDPVRFMSWIIPATCLLLCAHASAGSARHLARLVMDRVSRHRAGKVQVRLRSFRPARCALNACGRQR
jgi:hypothetical protein